MIHLFEEDPRFYSDPTFKDNHGSFSVINYGLNQGLKEIGFYSDQDSAKYIGFPSSLNFHQQYKDKKSFYITVWETINKITNFHIQMLKDQNKIIFGMSNQITNLYLKEGINCQTLHCGCDTDFWHQTLPKDNIFTFIHVNSSNVRSGLDLTLQAFHIAFQNNKNVRLIIKDTNTNVDTLKTRIQELKNKGSNIEYITKRLTRQEIRDMYSSSHVGLNLLRMTSWGFPLHEMSACNCLCVTGDFEPTNVLINRDYGILLKPSNEINIGDKLNELVNYWGLLNCYGSFGYSEEPRFYDFDIEKYADLLKNIYSNWNFYGKIDTRTAIIDKWKWKYTAENLVKHLNQHELAT
jgi:glycosyltransferase involved in cell wall biosynthesis